MKKLLSLILVLTISLSLIACELPGIDTHKPTPTEPSLPQTKAGDAVAFVTVDINPSIEITLDEDGIISSIYGANEDGQILLYGETEKLVNTNYENAISYITDLAIKLGYLNEETGSVRTDVVADDMAFAETITATLGDKIKATATQKGITLSVDTSDPFSLLCELETLKEKYPENIKIQEITPSEYKLALTLSEREDISIVAAVEYDSAEIIRKIQSAHTTLETYATEAYLAAKREAVRIFEKSMGIVVAGAYNDIYMQNLLAHIGTFYYGAAYQAYETAAITYCSIYEMKAFGDSMHNFELDDAAVTAIQSALRIPDTSVLENKDGKITIDSLIVFCDSFLSANTVSDDVKAEIRRIIDDAKTAAELANKATTTMYASDLAVLKSQIATVISTINSAYETAKLAMNTAQKAEIEAVLTDLALVEAKVGEIMDGGISLTEVEALAADVKAKAENMLTKIEQDLSKTELAAANARIESLKALQTQLTADFETRLSIAENTARKYMEDARKAREEANKA